MEYNKAKKVLDKIAGIIGVVVASILIILSIALIISSFRYFTGEMNYLNYYYDYYYDQYLYYEIDNSHFGWSYLLPGIYFLVSSILTLIFSIKLLKSPFLPNGQLRKKNGARIWLLVLSAITGDLVVLGLTIAALCLKDFKQPKAEVASQQVQAAAPQYTAAQPAFVAQPATVQTIAQDESMKEFYSLYEKIKELKKLKSLCVIDEAAFKRAVTKIVVDLTKE